VNKISLLIVEDKHEKMKLLSSVIDTNKMETDSSTNILDAQKKLMSNNYDIVLIDIQIPDDLFGDINPEGGIELLSWIETHPYCNKPTRIFGITSNTETKDKFYEHFINKGLYLIKSEIDNDTWLNAISATCNYLYDINQKNSDSLHNDTVQKALKPLKPEVFVSYAWTEESIKIVDDIQKAFIEDGIQLIRDKDELQYKDQIRQFMRRIGNGECIVVVISEKYLKSENCMFEIVEIFKQSNIHDRIFPVILHDAQIFTAIDRLNYIAYWEEKINALNDAIKRVSSENLTEIHEDLNRYSDNRRFFDNISGTLKDMNSLTLNKINDTGLNTLISNVRSLLIAH
jgi:CheY-like chemotaxis protein